MLFFVLITGKFYTFGMLRTLNSRAKLRRRMQSHNLGRTSLTGWNRDQETRKQETLKQLSPQIEIPLKVIFRRTWLIVLNEHFGLKVSQPHPEHKSP